MSLLEKYLFNRSKSKDDISYLNYYSSPIFTNFPGACLICDSSGLILEANPPVSSLTKYPQEELKEKSIFEFLQLDEEEFKSTYLDKINKGTTLNFETNLINKAKEIKNVEITITPIINQKDLIGMYVLILDIPLKEDLLMEKDLESLEEQLIQAQKVAGVGSWKYYVEKDEFYPSEEVCRIFGIDPCHNPQTMEHHIKLAHPEDQINLEKAVCEVLKGNSSDIEYRIPQKDGSEKYVRSKGTPVFNEKHQVVGILGTIQDITENYLLKRRFQVLVQDSNDVFEIISPDGTIQYISSAMEKVVGYKPEDLIGKNMFDFFDKKTKTILSKMLELTLKNPEKTIKGDISFKTKDGTDIFIEIYMKNQLNEPSIQGIVLNWRDITRRIEMQKKIAHISTHDELTGLPNRTYFRNILKKQCELSKENKASFALMMLDVSGFKYINDSLGYKIGDELIIQIANRLKSFLTEDMFLARYIGDHFIIIVSNLNKLEEYEKIANDIIKLFSDPFKFDVYDLNVNLNIGISVYPDDAEDFDSLKNHALIALFRSKDKGKNKYIFYSPQMNIENYKQFILRNDLKKAVEKEQFKVYYQPQVALKSNNILAAEALIRWEHPVWGMLSPNEFIPLAEETGFIVELGNWMLRKVCSHYKKWLQDGLPPIKVSVNYSSIQFFESNFIENIKKIIDEFELNPNFLIVEITESILMNNSKQIISNINNLKELGVQIALDDFGTGFSSLSYLNTLNIDILKIDRSFVKNIPSDEVSGKITKSVIYLAQELKIKLVAEGIENWEQLSYLRKLNCHTGQGFVYSQPVPIDEFEQMLARKKCKPICTTRVSIKPDEERRKFFRVNFPYLLESDITILELGGKKVQVGNTQVVIKNMGPGGLCFVSNANLPIRNDIILQFKTELVDEEISVYGCTVWTEEVEYGLYEYGIQFTFDESDRTELTRILNTFQIKLRNNPGFREGRFVSNSSPYCYFKSNNKIN